MYDIWKKYELLNALNDYTDIFKSTERVDTRRQEMITEKEQEIQTLLQS